MRNTRSNTNQTWAQLKIQNFNSNTGCKTIYSVFAYNLQCIVFISFIKQRKQYNMTEFLGNATNKQIIKVLQDYKS